MGFMDAIDNAFHAVEQLAQDGTDAVEGAASHEATEAATSKMAPGFGDVDTFEKAKPSSKGFSLSKLFGSIGDILSAGSLGSMLHTALDKLGLPDWASSVAGGVLDFCTGNYVGAAANGLDALGDAADACGDKEIGGFLKMGGQVAGMFAGGGLGQLGKLGELGDVAEMAGKTEKYVQQGASVMGDLSSGNVFSAGEGIMNMFGDDLGPLTKTLGKDISPETLEKVRTCFDHAKQGLHVLGEATDNGRIDLSELLHQPLEAALQMVEDKTGVDLGEFRPMLKPAIQLCTGAAGASGSPVDIVSAMFGDRANGAGGNGLLDVFRDAIGEVLHDDQAMRKADDGHWEGPVADVVGQQNDLVESALKMCGADPEAARVIAEVLGHVAGMGEKVDLQARQAESMRV